MDCRVSVGLVLWQQWTVTYQKDWHWGSSVLYHISNTGTGTVVYCDVSIGWNWDIIEL